MPFFTCNANQFTGFYLRGTLTWKRLKKTYIFDQEKVATEFNQFFANIDPKLAK